MNAEQVSRNGTTANFAQFLAMQMIWIWPIAKRARAGKPNQESISKYFAGIERRKARFTIGTMSSVDFRRASCHLLEP